MAIAVFQYCNNKNINVDGHFLRPADFTRAFTLIYVLESLLREQREKKMGKIVPFLRNPKNREFQYFEEVFRRFYDIGLSYHRKNITICLQSPTNLRHYTFIKNIMQISKIDCKIVFSFMLRLNQRNVLVSIPVSTLHCDFFSHLVLNANTIY